LKKIAIFLGILVACNRAPDIDDLHGGMMFPPLPKPDFTLTDQEGADFQFRERTDGYLTIVFFGFTHCPDVCPMHMSMIARIMDDLGPDIQARTKVIFVSVDPDRDTPDRLRGWLANFDSEFVGLTGTQQTLRTVESLFNLPNARIGPVSEGNYSVEHSATVFAFTPDNEGRALYSASTSYESWLNDIPILLDADWPDHL